MKSQKTMKRALAGVMAMLTVAAFVPANVGAGGLFTGGAAIVASAADYTLLPPNSNGSTENEYGKIECWVESGYIYHYTVTAKSGYRFLKWSYYEDMGDGDKEYYESSSKTLSLEDWYRGGLTAYFTPVTSISGATVNLTENNTVLSLTLSNGSDVTTLRDFVITYGTDESHTETEIPNELGTYYAYVQASDSNTKYEGSAKSAAFEVTELTNRASETLNTNAGTGENYTYYANNFRIDVNRDRDKDGFMVNDSGFYYAKISSLYGATIEKLVLVRGYYTGTPIVDSPTATCSANGDTFTLTNINASSVKLTCTGGYYAQIKQVTAYFSGDFVVTETFSETPAGCFTDGNTKYVTNTEGKYYNVDGEEPVEIEEGSWIIPAIGYHTYGEPVWNWTESADGEGYSATVTFTCEKGDDTQALTADVTADTVAPTYTADGSVTYTASVEFEGKTYTDTKEVVLPMLALTHVDAVAVGCETDGSIEYWHDEANDKYFTDASGENEISLEDIVIPATGHSYGQTAPKWTWTELEDGSYRAKVTFTCDTCGAKTTVRAETIADTTEATYTAEGKIVYNAFIDFEGVSYTKSKTVTIPVLTFDPASVAITDAKATDGSTKITFNYKADLDPKSDDVTYGVLIKRKAVETTLTEDDATDFVLSAAEASFRSEDKGEGVTLRPYIQIDGVRFYGEQVNYDYTYAMLSNGTDVAITNAATVAGAEGKLRFTYEASTRHEGELAYGVLIKRGNVEGLLTAETASADMSLSEATAYFRSEDMGEGITLRPYISIDGVRIFGEQVTYTYEGVNRAEGIAEITGVSVYNANNGKLDFTYSAYYEGEGTVTYGVLIKRGLEEGVKLTRKLAAADLALDSAEATFRSQDKGEGITLRPYIEIDGVRKYGEQVTYYLSDLVD